MAYNSNVSDVLVVCGPTATGKTRFALEICQKIPAEIISADSRQIYRGMDIITGKDVPPGSKFITSAIKWGNGPLGYYKTSRSRIWLYDLVDPDTPFSVSLWQQAAKLVIHDISSRHKLPIIVGGTGLYIKSLFFNLIDLSVPPNFRLRDSLSSKSPDVLFNILSRINSSKAASLNQSDRANPRRLIRAIETSLSGGNPKFAPLPYKGLLIGLHGPRDFLRRRIDDRILERLKLGARQEAKFLSNRFSPSLPSMSATGYRSFFASDWISAWKISEYQYLKRQMTWFNRQPGIQWFDISVDGWEFEAKKLLFDWYNKLNVKKN